LYNSCASQSGLKGAKVVAEITSLLVGEITVHETIADPIAMEQPSQKEWQGVTHRVSLASELVKIDSKALNLAVVIDEFDADIFAENVDTEQHAEKDDETVRSESDEGNVQPSVDTTPDAPVGTVDEGYEANMPSSTVTPCDVPASSCIDWSSYYTNEELRTLKLNLINLQDYPNHKGICHIESDVCDSAVVDDEGNLKVREEVIKKGQLFESFDAVKLLFQDYVVHHHRPNNVAKSNKDVWYIIRCQILSYNWGVWLRHTKNEIH
jgi:hypothetical protein